MSSFCSKHTTMVVAPYIRDS